MSDPYPIDTLLRAADQGGSRQAMDAFMHALPGATLFVALVSDQPIGADGTVPAGAVVTEVGQDAPEEDDIVPTVFTCPEAAQQSIEVAHILSPETGRSLYQRYDAASGLYIQGIDGAYFVAPRELQRLQNGEPIWAPRGGEGTDVSEPTIEPEHLLNPLRAFCAARKTVKAAFRARIEIEGVETIVLYFDDSDAKTLVEAVGPVIEHAKYSGDAVMLASIEDRPALADFLRDFTKPFYLKRKLFGLF